METWLLPGMDATGLLWRPLLHALGSDARAFAYPDAIAGYDDVLAHLGTPGPDTTVVAESFSGPAAIRLAHAHPDRVRALMLIATFARGSRAPLVLGRLLEGLLDLRPPALAIRALMVGMDADRALVDLVRDAISRVPATTLLARVRAAATIDVRRELAELRVPIVWVRASRDRLVSARATRDALTARPDLDVRTVDGPHLLAQARPGPIAELIRRAQGRAEDT